MRWQRLPPEGRPGSTWFPAPRLLDAPAQVERICVTSALEMRDVILQSFLQAGRNRHDGCGKRLPAFPKGGPQDEKVAAAETLHLEPNPDILASLGAVKPPDQVLVGFAAETENLAQNARDKLMRKNLDLIVANDLTEAGGRVWLRHKRSENNRDEAARRAIFLV